MKTPAVSTNLRNVVCPGGTASCPDGNTCCKLSSGEYGCCPLPNVSDSFFLCAVFKRKSYFMFDPCGSLYLFR